MQTLRRAVFEAVRQITGLGDPLLGFASSFCSECLKQGSWEVFLRQPVSGLFVPLEAAIEGRDCFTDEGAPNMAMGGVLAARRAGSIALGVEMSLRPEGDFFELPADNRDPWETTQQTRGHIVSGSIQPHPRASEIGEWLLVRFATQSPAASGLVRRVLEHFTLSQSRVDFASPSARAGEAAQTQTSVAAAPAPELIFPLTDLSAVPGDCRLVVSSVLQFASGFEQEALADPVAPKPYDVLRQRIGRLTHIPKWRKCPITADKVQTTAWHHLNGERMIRQYFTDRGLAKVLGKPTFYTAAGQNIISFFHLQPMEMRAK